jgi:molybdopterin/thiamine biosynthesis adenylyltransferase
MAARQAESPYNLNMATSHENPLSRRYSRQILFSGIGVPGQRKLTESCVAVVGCGALGSQQASLLVRAGVGEVILVDRDFVEESNLQRQVLYDEKDAADRTPKAIAAAAHLQRANSDVRVIAQVADLTPRNIASLLGNAKVILDGTDNFETRYLLNDFSVQSGIAWIYGAAVASEGICFAVLPGKTPCLACLFPAAPEGLHETCDTSGILNATASLVASLQVAEAIKLLVGDAGAASGKLFTADVWKGRFQQVDAGNPLADCRACQRREFPYLSGDRTAPITLCGRDSVQIHERHRPLDFAALAATLSPLGVVRYNSNMLRFLVDSFDITMFPDGRAIIKGTTDPAQARSLYARYVGA